MLGSMKNGCIFAQNYQHERVRNNCKGNQHSCNPKI